MRNKHQRNKNPKLNDINMNDKEIKDSINNKTNDNTNKNNKKNYNTKKYVYKYYIFFVGSKGIGTKTSLIKRIKESKYVNTTDENTEIYEKIIYEKDDKKFILYLIDSKEAKKDKDDRGEKKIINYMYGSYENADCIVMGYDVTNKQSLQEIKSYWNKEIKENTKTNLIYLIGNKIDLKDNIEVLENEVKEFADNNNIKHFQISVKNNINIQNFIDDLTINIEKIDNNSQIFYGNPSKESYKVAFLGDSGIGAKTSLINRMFYHRFNENELPTCSASYSAKFIRLKSEKDVLIEFWDTVGQEKYRNLALLFSKNSDCIVLGYDITSKESYDNINIWYKLSKKYSETNLIYLVPNKIDLYESKAVDEEEARNYARENNMRFFPISCKTTTGIKEFINDLISEIIKR